MSDEITLTIPRVNPTLRKWYQRWLIGHIVGYSLSGAILFPLSFMDDNRQYPVAVCADFVQCASGGLVIGAIMGTMMGLPGPLSYVILGCRWLKHH